MKLLRFILFVLAWMGAALCAAWAAGALYFDSAGALVAILFVIALLASVIFVRGKLLKLAIVFGAFAVVVLWWFTLKPSNNRAWQPDVAQTAWAQINGDEITIHNVRNCDYLRDFPICVAKDGTIIVALQWDYAVWTAGAASFTDDVQKLAGKSGQSAHISIDLSGQVSPRSREELEKRGITLQDRLVPGPLK